MSVRNHFGAMLFALTFVLTGCPRPEPDLPVETVLSLQEREALQIVQLICSTSEEEGEAIWPGFAPQDYPLLVFSPGKRSFLINPYLAPSGLEPIVMRGVDIPVYALESNSLGLSASLPFAKDVEVAGNRAFLVRHSAANKREAWFRLVVHELFHYYQHQAWDRGEFPEEACRYPYDSDENGLLAFAEQQLLAKLLAMLELDGLEEEMALYLAVRSVRYGLGESGETALCIEEWEELTEGTARYTEEMYAMATGMSSRERVLKRLTGFFKTFKPRTLQKWKYYRTGLALGLILDALQHSEWKEAAKKGKGPYPFALDSMSEQLAGVEGPKLKKTIGFFETDREGVERALQDYLKNEEEAVEKWTGEGRYRVTIILPRKGGAYYVNRGLTVQLEDCFRLATGVVSFVDRRYGLEVFRRGVATRNFDDSYHVVFYDDLSSGSLILDGTEVELTEGAHPFSDSIRAPFEDWRMSLEAAGAVTVEENSIIIEMEN